MESVRNVSDRPIREEVALYFPNIEVPQTPWFTQVLLYWDKAASIVPHKLYGEEPVSPYMRALHDEGLLEFINPLAVVDLRADSFEKGFFEVLATESSLPGRHFRPTYTNVHMDKLDSSVFRELEQRGLAERFPHDREWWHIETETADLYMKYMAGVMSGARPGMSPVTDQADLVRGLTEPINTEPSVTNLDYS